MSSTTVDPTSGVPDVSTEAVATVQSEFAYNRPFGDAGYINEASFRRYRHRLGLLCSQVPEAAALNALLSERTVATEIQILSDPTVRIAINNLVISRDDPSGPREPWRAVLASASLCLLDPLDIPPLQRSCPQAQRLRPQLWVWTNERPNDAAAQIVRRAYDNQEHGHSVLVTPDARSRRTLEQAVQLLDELLPDLLESALAHVQLVAIVDRSADARPLTFDSFTVINMPGMIFLAQHALGTPWKAAEYILHEALHQKWYDLQHTHSMLRRGYRYALSPHVRSVWNRMTSDHAEQWPCCRAAAAFHVYVQLSLLFVRMAQCERQLSVRYGAVVGPAPVELFRQACDRAAYLGEQLTSRANEFGEAGQFFIAWLRRQLSLIDPDPPADGAIGHHLVDLYARETAGIRAAIRRAAPAVAFSEPLRHLDQAERAVVDLLRVREPAAYPEGGGADGVLALADQLAERQRWLQQEINVTKLRQTQSDDQHTVLLDRLDAIAQTASRYGSHLRS